MNDSEKMQQAAELIKAKQYEKARALLHTVKHPQAERWLAKIDQLSPPSKSSTKPDPKSSTRASPKAKKSAGGLRCLPLILVLLILLVAGAGALFLLMQGEEEDVVAEATEEATAEMTEEPETPTPTLTASPEPTLEASPTSAPLPTSDATVPPRQQRERVQIADAFSPAAQQRSISIELVSEWQIAPEDSFGTTLKLGDDYAGTGVTVARISPDLGVTNLKAYAESTLGADELLSLTNTRVQGRVIWIRSVQAATGRVDTFYVQDSDGDLAFLSTIATVLNHDELKQEIAFMASTLEVE